MSQPPQWRQPQWGQNPTQPIPPQPPAVPKSRPGWARKRIIIPAAIVLFFVGVGIGSSGSNGSTKDAASATPAPTVTVTVAAKGGKAAPAPTVTKTVTAKPAAKETTAAPAGKAVFKVWGSAPSGVDITYGSDGENIQGHGLPMTKTLTVKSDALYYQVTAQLQGGGDVRCSVTIDGHTKTGHASGGYNICSAQLNGDFSGGFS